MSQVYNKKKHLVKEREESHIWYCGWRMLPSATRLCGGTCYENKYGKKVLSLCNQII